jgi:hypothetical protein
MTTLFSNVNFLKYKQDHEKLKKEQLLQSPFFEILMKENEKEYKKLLGILENKTSDEIEFIIKYFINLKSVQIKNDD